MYNSWNDRMNLFFNKPKLTTVLTHSLTFTSWSFSRNPLSTSFKTFSVYLTDKQAELASVLRELCEFRSFRTIAKVFRPTNKTSKMNGNSFPNGTIFRMHMYISSKVTHAKYAVAETRISGVKRITVIHVLRNLLPLLTMYFCIEFQDFKLMLNHV